MLMHVGTYSWNKSNLFIIFRESNEEMLNIPIELRSTRISFPLKPTSQVGYWTLEWPHAAMVACTRNAENVFLTTAG